MISLLSFLSSGILNMLASRYLGVRGSLVLTMLCLHIGLFSGILLWYEVFVGESYIYYDLGSWFTLGSLNVNWSLYIDLQCAHLLLTVCVISYAVHVYSYVYMKEDPHLPLFISYLSFFSFFMMYLACATDLFGILVGWEGIGVFSYLLIGYYTHRLSASKSALKAVVVNRISDGFLLWGILGLYWYHGTTDIDLVTFNGYTAEFYSVAILIGAMGKSAQIGLHVWLADAMEGPTPVSALLHAACIVCAGVFVMVRLNVFFNDLIIIIGSITALMASIFGLFQADLKRVIAFSTCSQLGYSQPSDVVTQNVFNCSFNNVSLNRQGDYVLFNTYPKGVVSLFRSFSTGPNIGRSYLKGGFNGSAVDILPSQYVEVCNVTSSGDRYAVKSSFARFLWNLASEVPKEPRRSLASEATPSAANLFATAFGYASA